MSGSQLVLPGNLVRREAWAEIAVRLVIAGFLAFVAVDAELVVQVIIACGVAYHVVASLRLLAPLRPDSSALTLDRGGFTLRLMWRDRRVAWSQVHEVAVQRARYLAGQRNGILVTTGDAKGPTGFVFIPSIFAPGPHELAAEMEHWRGR